MSPKDNGFTIIERHHRYFPWKSQRFWRVTQDGGFPNYHSRQKYVPCWEWRWRAIRPIRTFGLWEKIIAQLQIKFCKITINTHETISVMFAMLICLRWKIVWLWGVIRKCFLAGQLFIAQDGQRTPCWSAVL